MCIRDSAFGASYPGTTKGGTALTKEELLARGMNQSRLHEDVDVYKRQG